MTPAMWEDVVESNNFSTTERLQVPGGWLYRTVVFSPTDKSDEPITTDSVALVFVPWDDATKKREQLAAARAQIVANSQFGSEEDSEVNARMK